jgi:hypothetical protein
LADFGRFVFTDKGKLLCAKTQIEVPLHFTRAACGDGFLPDGEELKSLNGLINERLPLAIDSMTVQGDGTAIIRTVLTNRDIVHGFFVREIGLFALDPDEGEILYAVANAGEYADYLAPKEVATVLEEVIDLITVIDDAEHVTVTLAESAVYVTKQEYSLITPMIVLTPGVPQTSRPEVLWLQIMGVAGEDPVVVTDEGDLYFETLSPEGDAEAPPAFGDPDSLVIEYIDPGDKVPSAYNVLMQKKLPAGYDTVYPITMDKNVWNLTRMPCGMP